MNNTLQVEFSPSETQEAFIRSHVLENCFFGPRGEGKCLAKGTSILMYNGTILPVEEIKTGDLLMGDDSTPRLVISTIKGAGGMFAVVPWKGNHFIGNSEHILCLQERKYKRGRINGIRQKRIKKPFSVIEMPILKYMAESSTRKNSLYLYRVGVDWPYREVKIDPYLMGLWLGDGSSYRPAICTGDPEIEKYLLAAASFMNLNLETEPQKGNCSIYRFSTKLRGPNRGTDGRFRGTDNIFSQAILYDYDLYANKHIPHIYKCNSRKVRLELLAGIIDSDGWVNHGGYGIVVKQRKFADDIVFTAKSLGLAAYVKPTLKQIKSRNFIGTYYRIYISGDCSVIPVMLPRKKVARRRQIKDVLRTRIEKIVVLEDDEYYGFTLTGNGRFLLGDFTVTHNTDSGIMAMTYHASLTEKKYRPVPWAIVRDTWKNLERTTYRSFMYPTNPKSLAYQLRGRIHERDGGRQLKLVDKKGDAIWIAFLFGMDTPDDLNQLLSMQLGGIWLEEAAPAMQEDIGAGLPEETWTLGITSLRHPIMSDKAVGFLKEWGKQLDKMTPRETKQGLDFGALVRTPYDDIVPRNRRAQITMNYPSEDHWTWVRFYDEGDPLSRAMFRIPRGENVYLDDQYRENMEKSLRGRTDLLDRLVIGRPAHVQLGIAVTPEYHETLNGGPWHRANITFDPMPNITVIRFWDGDLHPAPYSQDTEILTKNGWKFIKDTTIGEEVFTLNPETREIEYSYIVEKVFRKHIGNMYCWKGRNYDLRVTDDHSIPYINKKGDIYPFKRAKDFKSRKIKMIKGGEWAGYFGDQKEHCLPRYKSDGKYFKQYEEVPINIELYCAFMGLYLSEGSCSKYKKKKTDNKAEHYEVAIWQKRRNPEIEKILNDFPFEWGWVGNGWKCHSVQLYNFLKPFGRSYEKFVPKIIKNLPPEYLKIFTKYYIIGDGTDNRRIYTTSKKIVDDFQEIALKLGKRATYRIVRDIGAKVIIKGIPATINKPQYVIDFANKSQTLSIQNKIIERVKGELVYCVMVQANHIIYVRRNGKPMWGGNCHFGQITPRGKYIGLDTVRSSETGEGMKQFVDTKVKPLLIDRYGKVTKWRDLGDPTLNDRDPSDSSQTAAGIIEKELNTHYEGGVLRWKPRKEALQELLTKTLSSGEPMFTLSKHDKIMHRSLSGGWHYNKSASGKVSDEPDNNDINSHPAAGLSHGLAKIFKYEREQRIKIPKANKRIAVGNSVQTLHGGR